MFNSLWPHGLQPARLLCPWDSLGKNTGVDCHALLQGIFPTQGLNPGLLHCRWILYCLSHKEAHIIHITCKIYGKQNLKCKIKCSEKKNCTWCQIISGSGGIFFFQLWAKLIAPKDKLNLSIILAFFKKLTNSLKMWKSRLRRSHYIFRTPIIVRAQY